jgi:hypothetical protein
MNALQHWSGQNSFPTVQCCSGKQPHSMLVSLHLHLWRFAHCTTGQGKIASLLFSAALQSSLTACLCHCIYTYGHLLFIQVCNDAIRMHCSTCQGKIASRCSVLLCKKASQYACATAITAMEICCSYRCTVMQHQSTAALVRAKQLPCCSVLLWKKALQHACVTAITPMEIK